ncbi:hypothetical protein EVAR_56269_1 [Eumeta japonica]|uniref:Uncharacterized protein n=1 Tax=Eumeta variegata TaxID=151549 RepID=A0A4C1YFY4_EUMVA|nr:hypothetical protein EVAR_56269_1 [Eumeta japonica]
MLLGIRFYKKSVGIVIMSGFDPPIAETYLTFNIIFISDLNNDRCDINGRDRQLKEFSEAWSVQFNFTQSKNTLTDSSVIRIAPDIFLFENNALNHSAIVTIHTKKMVLFHIFYPG